MHISRPGTGLIPAGARQTPRLPAAAPRAWAHPRRCGADRRPDLRAGSSPGSSPQVRGRPRTSPHGSGSPGLIPAGAGQTLGDMNPSMSPRAHPRRCGADLVPIIADQNADGSSPQVRGRRVGRVGRASGGRLIPAGAGQTPLTLGQKGDTAAHPRRCGADERHRAFQSGVGNRLIPAGAGQTASASARSVSSAGSSPQVRGRQLYDITARELDGLIPAGAGQTGHERLRVFADEAHPRRCGADMTTPNFDMLVPGSSPQVRGRRVCTGR